MEPLSPTFRDRRVIRDAAIGLALTAIAFSAALFAFPVTESLERKLYDWRLRGIPVPPSSDDIRLVAIDGPSIEAVGRWPWSRGVMADLLERIARGEPRVLACAVIFSEPDENPGLVAVRDLKEEYDSLLESEEEAFEPLLTRLRKDSRYKKSVRDHPFGDLRGFGKTIADAARELDTDGRFKATLGSIRRLLLAYYFRSLGRGGEEPPEVLTRLKNSGFLQSQLEPSPDRPLAEGGAPLLPLEELSKKTDGLGHVTVIPDPDGRVRRDAPVMQCRGQVVPSLALQMARVAMNVKMSDVRIVAGKELRLGSTSIPLDEDSRLLIRYSGGFDTFKKDSAVDVLRDGGVPSKSFKDKLVLVGITDGAVGSSFATPVDPSYQFNGIVLSALRNIWEGRFLSRPAWAKTLELSWLALVGLFVTAGLPLLRARWALAATAVFAAVTLAGGWYGMVVKNYWIKMFYPLALLGISYAVLTIKRFFFTEMRKEWVEAQSIETNKSLGLSYQSQGLLDMAFEKLRKCPVDDDMKGILYNVALDFERKRQFGKAGVVYDHIAQVDPGFKDIQERSRSAKQASESGGLHLPGSKAGGTVVFGAGAAKPTLGRYEIEKELGRGAMGVVYLGRDPKINRSVAIKTLRFDDDTDQETAAMVKDRFFREAESAGTLNHPHIIRIFDAGEDSEISYIAMELLEGEDLKKYAERANLLPAPLVVEYAATIADALDYAHAHGVVHRDIKPANVMRLKDGSLRVTDFGIARIAASSKTATGTVLGTPSYMSPEQLSGKKIDGRSDLFSLGVMLYELLTGEKPFVGDNIATLLFKIAGEDPPDPASKRPDRITADLNVVLRKAMAKDPDARYQRGSDMARELRMCLMKMNELSQATETVEERPVKPSSQAKKEEGTAVLDAREGQRP